MWHRTVCSHLKNLKYPDQTRVSKWCTLCVAWNVWTLYLYACNSDRVKQQTVCLHVRTQLYNSAWNADVAYLLTVLMETSSGWRKCEIASLWKDLWNVDFAFYYKYFALSIGLMFSHFRENPMCPYKPPHCISWDFFFRRISQNVGHTE